MLTLENLLAVLHYLFNGLSEMCWAGKEILRTRREIRESGESRKKKKKKKG